MYSESKILPTNPRESDSTDATFGPMTRIPLMFVHRDSRAADLTSQSLINCEIWSQKSNQRDTGCNYKSLIQYALSLVSIEVLLELICFDPIYCLLHIVRNKQLPVLYVSYSMLTLTYTHI